jgi:RNA polymerase sigma-70 factor, ECF subfamily
MSSRFTAAALPALEAASASDLGNCQTQPEEVVVGLFDEFRDPLLRYLSTFGLLLPDSEEVLQEVFLSLFHHLRSGKPRDNLRGWLFRVAHNLALKRRYQTHRNLAAGTEALIEEWAIDPDPSPEEQMVNSQAQRRLLAVFRALPEQDRKCLSLRAEGLRYREIAEALDMSLGAVSLSLARSLARIAGSAQR